MIQLCYTVPVAAGFSFKERAVKKVITYGTFDLLHRGHRRLLERARALGDYLVVGITSDSYDQYRGKLNVVEDLATRMENVRATGLADEIIVEEYEGQKLDDVISKKVDVFTIGSDWTGEFDYLKAYCDVVYLERTRGISSSELRAKAHRFIRFGVVGAGVAARRFVLESKYVSGLEAECVMDEDPAVAQAFLQKNELLFSTGSYEELLAQVDAVFLSSGADRGGEYIRQALLAKKHVLCDAPLCLPKSRLEELFQQARKQGVVLMECYETLYCPGFQRLVSLAKSGRIGEIKHVMVSCTAWPGSPAKPGELLYQAKLPLLAVHRILGFDSFRQAHVETLGPDEENQFTQLTLTHQNAIASLSVGSAVRQPDQLVICGTNGYFTVPSPWWKTEYFEQSAGANIHTRKFYFEFLGKGVRYVLVEFLKSLALGTTDSFSDVSLILADMVQRIVSGEEGSF